MQVLGFDWGYVLVMLFNLLLLGGWIVLTILALFQLRNRELPETARAIWILILLVPILGALAFWIVRPRGRLPGVGEDEK
jgi:Phospholipase_D-nuclease N-terminal